MAQELQLSKDTECHHLTKATIVTLTRSIKLRIPNEIPASQQEFDFNGVNKT